MLNAPIPADEADRLQNLKLHNILDSGAEREFDDIALLASQICQTPIATISLIDANRQWFKSRIGLDISQSGRDSSFCGHAILGRDPLVVPDALRDDRFAHNPLVLGDPHIRFYAGTPLISAEGYALGTLCVIDRIPRQLSEGQIQSLAILGRQVVNLLNMRRAISTAIAAEEFARSTVNALTAQIAILDHAGTIIAVNQAWLDFAVTNPPAPSDFLKGANYLTVCESATGPCSEEALAVAQGIKSVLRGERNVFSLEYPCHSPSEQRWFVARVSRFVGDGPPRVVVAHENVTERRLAEEQLRELSLHDALTGLPNRLLFADRVDQALRQFKRDPTMHFAVLFIDLDRFKMVNDSLGHEAGDVLLKTIAARLQSCLRSTDSLSRSPNVDSIGHTLARMGGDEFTLVLQCLKNPIDVSLVAVRVLDAISKPITFGAQEFTTTASIGIVNAAATYDTAQELLRDADLAMYRAKATGKARYVIFDTTMHVTAVSRMQLESDLRRAIERREMLLHYQPIVSLKSRQIEGFEALVRWSRADEQGNNKLINPADFIPIAEDTGLIVPIGEWVVEEACRQLADWKRSYPAAANLTMSVNVSGKQLIDDRFFSQLRNALQLARLDPASIRLEITESVLLDDRIGTISKLAAFKASGVLLSLDDFGTGYSSLSCLHRFPIDFLKVDRSFVQNLDGLNDSVAIVQTIVNLAQNMGMNVVAEGIETPEQLAILQSLGCRLGQGYLFSRPLSAKDTEELLGCRTLAIAA